MTSISQPGVFDIPADEYHRDPVKGGSLSSSAARRLLATCPARWRYEQDHPTPPTDAMELGTAAHSTVLGTGAEIVTVDAADWRSKTAKEMRAEARRSGGVAVLAKDMDRLDDMAAAVRKHPVAGVLLEPGAGHTEQTLIWRDPGTGVWCRAMLDRRLTLNGRVLVVDYKTTADAAGDSMAKSVARYGYHQQGAFYSEGVEELDLGAPHSLFVFQETSPPHLIRVVELDYSALQVGRRRNRRALEIFRDCRESGIWPGYPTEIETVALPPWAEREEELIA